MPEHESVDGVDPLMLVRLRLHVRPETGAVALRLTVPDHPLRGTAVINDAPWAPAFTPTLSGVGDTTKSWTARRTVAECVRELLVPVTVPLEVHDHVDVKANVSVALHTAV